MPPKAKEAPPKKPLAQVTRPTISNSSLNYVPEDALEGFQERIETDIEWTLEEAAVRRHRQKCNKENIPELKFSEALQNQLNQSILAGFLDDNSPLTLEEQWQVALPMTLWDIEKFANDEGRVCFESLNSITDDLETMIKKAVKLNDRNYLRKCIMNTETLRIINAKMTILDEGLNDFLRLTSLNLGINLISILNPVYLPRGLQSLELQANSIRYIEGFAQFLPEKLLYLGLSKNLLTNDGLEGLSHLPYQLTVLDMSDNDIYNLLPVLETLGRLPYLNSLFLSGNPCSVCACYARSTISRLPRLRWLDAREVLPADRAEPHSPHPDDLLATYFNFTVIRIMSAQQPPKPEKGAVTTFHVELELPLLDATRRRFLMYRRNESLVEMLPPPEDDEWPPSKQASELVPPNPSRTGVETGSKTSLQSNIYDHLTAKNPREIQNYTTFESNRIQWSKVMNFQEPTLRIFCPDLRALRDTFQSVITIRLIYSVTYATKQGKAEKKSAHAIKPPGEQRVTLASVRCALRKPDWSQAQQHFHWDETLGTDDAIHWGDGDLSAVQYTQGPAKPVKSKQESEAGGSKQVKLEVPESLTCHFGFGIETLH